MPLDRSFYAQNTVTVAKKLIGKYIVFNGQEYQITETEAYCGPKDKACHGHWRKRTSCETLWGSPGHLYIYLNYGIHYMLNIVTEKDNYPSAVLIRGLDKTSGPGRVTKLLKIDKTFNNLDITSGKFIIIDKNEKQKIMATPRIGINYAGIYAKKLWRFVIK